jgi:hypothetical protein
LFIHTQNLTITTSLPHHRVVSSIFEIPREEFYLIDDFDLVSVVNITYKNRGMFMFESYQKEMMTTEEPYKQVADYMVRAKFLCRSGQTIK